VSTSRAASGFPVGYRTTTNLEDVSSDSGKVVVFPVDLSTLSKFRQEFYH
jgi:hypothetical protein